VVGGFSIEPSFEVADEEDEAPKPAKAPSKGLVGKFFKKKK
jgi:hypothetical protein